MPLRNIYICGEISNFTNYYRSGHLYFTLKDERSQIKAVMFSSSAGKLKFEPENGMSVICRGRISVYEKSGEYQLYADDMQPDGIGALNLAFEQLKKKLFDEGVCSDEIKKPLPKYPRKIGVATSNIGAAVEDIKNIANRRFPAAEIVICPTIVQGEYAPDDIVKSLEMLDSIPDVDVIIAGRGGGSVEDLWAFNTEKVARAVIACKTPVVSAVGHETDFTICDFVADMRAPTPSAAAEIVCPDIRELIAYISNLKARINFRVNDIVQNEMLRLSNITESGIFSDEASLFESYFNQLSDLTERIYGSFEKCVESRESELAFACGKINALSPLAVLSRGYCIAEKSNIVINSAFNINFGDEIKLRFSDGSVKCTVDEVSLNEK
ncbi:MAG: exodeoxyribonuclease VII large subunit [Clostridiales bacterium]|nr:exodeoxyribonuclease VII large subunit [Clostridiales bacterium]